MKTRLPLGFVAVNTIMFWLATAVAAVALWPIYQSTALVILVAVTLLIGSTIAIVGAVFRWPGHLVIAATLIAFLAAGVPLAVPGRALFGLVPTLPGFLDLLTGTALGWKQLLTITLPVGEYQSLLVPAFILVLASTVVGLSIALRARWGELAAIGPVVLFLVAVLFGPTATTWPLQLSLGLLGVLLVWFIWRRWYRRREAIRFLAGQARDSAGRPLETAADHRFVGARTLLSAALIMVIAGGSAVAATLVAPPSAHRVVLRSTIVQPFDPRVYPSPLSGFRRYEEPTQASSVMLDITGLTTGARIRIATLDAYNGVVYSVGSSTVTSESGSFTRVPATFDQSKTKGKQVSIDVTVGDYSGPWLPTVGKFERVAFSGKNAGGLRDTLFYNDTSGTAAVIDTLSPGDRYSLDAVQLTQPTSSQLNSLMPGPANLPRIGVLPDQLTTTLDGWVRGVSSPGARLSTMISQLKQNGYVSHGVSADEPASRSGHAADRITQLLTDQRMIGDQEQYSVTAALMARQLGFPARVVIGFAPEDVRAGAVTAVKGSDISAWIEVNTTKYGWVTIDPTPSVRQIPDEKPQEPSTIARPQSPVQPPAPELQVPRTQVPPDTSQDQPDSANPLLVILLVVLGVLGWIALGLAILISPFVAIIAAKARRRRLRRKASSAQRRIHGGWQEFEDAVLDHGFVPRPFATRAEVAETVGGAQPFVLASIADRATFAPDAPDSREADLLWQSVTELRASLDDGLSRRERIRAAVSIRSLRGYSGREKLRTEKLDGGRKR